MNKYKITQQIEAFAPLETQEKWDCSGFTVETELKDIKKIMLCLTVTNNIIQQAKEHNCDMIISHHPLFFVPLEFKNIDIYCAHTNLDKAEGGTTDTLIKILTSSRKKAGFNKITTSHFSNAPRNDNFLRYIDYDTTLTDFIEELKTISPNLRYTNNKNIKKLTKIAFCAGSGSEFIQEAFENGADALVTGDIKFHTAVESPIVLFDIGHFESEILVLPVFEKIIGSGVEIIYAQEKSPFIF